MTRHVAALLALAVLPALAAPPASEGWDVVLTDAARELGLVHETIYGDVDRKRFIVETNGCGVALADLDGDGWVDPLILSGTRLEPGTRSPKRWPAGAAPTPRLYRNLRGRLADATPRSGLDRTGWASSVCAGDADGDGRVDLFVTYFGRNALYRNLGDLRFEDATARAGLLADRDRWGAGCSFLDYDRDGDLDLFVANYLAFDLASAPEPGKGSQCFWKGVPVNCGPKGLPTDTNLLYRNDGGLRFTDVSVPSGIAAVTGRYSMTALAADLDEDGWLDIYVAADSTASILYRNNRDGTFTDIALTSGTAYSDLGAAQAGMGVALGDYDADGRADLIKTHFADDIPALYRGRGRGLFEDVATQAGLSVQNRFVQWGVGWPDLDRDGWMDLLIVTGNVYPEVEAQLPQYPHRSPRIVFRNLGNGRFADVSDQSGPGAAAAHSSRGAAFGDLDNDGDVDVLVMNMNAPPSLLRTSTSSDGHWIAVALEGTRSNRQGIGATVRVTAAGRSQTRAVLSQSSFYAVDDFRLHFGLGRSDFAERIEVHWPSGQLDVHTRVAADRLVVLREGGATPR